MAETTPVGSFENDRFFENHRLRTGFKGDKRELVDIDTRTATVITGLQGVGDSLRKTNKTLQPFTKLTAFHATIDSQQTTIIANKKTTLGVQQNKFRGFGKIL